MADQPDPPTPRPALSPSRATDFKQCPLLYRFRAIDRLPEATSAAQLRGSVVHAALEQLYGLPAGLRSPDTARSLVQRAWDQMVAAEPELAGELDPGQPTQLLEDARALVSGYYRLEDPTRFDPQCCEQRVEVELADGTLLRGYIDRIDVAATGELRVVDYKTGKAPPAARALAEFKAMFQMKFYAVAISVARRAAHPAAAHLSGRRPAARLFTGPRRAIAFRKDVDGDLACYPIRRRDRRFPPQPIAALRLVPASTALPGLRRNTTALSRVAHRAGGINDRVEVRCHRAAAAATMANPPNTATESSSSAIGRSWPPRAATSLVRA